MLHLYIVSDSSGETAGYVGEAAYKQFVGLIVTEHMWPVIRSNKQIDELIIEIKKNPGPVVYTMINSNTRSYLIEQCAMHCIPNICPLDAVIGMIADYTKLSANKMLPGKYENLTEDYFRKINSINFTVAHDDGRNVQDYEYADILLLGVSRTSKTPISFYLAHRGYKVANLPIIYDKRIEDVDNYVGIGNGNIDINTARNNDNNNTNDKVNNDLNKYNFLNIKNPIMVGLTISAERLIDLRQNRIEKEVSVEYLKNYNSRNYNNPKFDNYLSLEEVQKELNYAKRLYNKFNVQIIDVTHKAIEEISGEIIRLLNVHLGSI